MLYGYMWKDPAGFTSNIQTSDDESVIRGGLERKVLAH